MKVHVVEGNRTHLDGGAMFGNAPKAMWEKWIEPDADNRIELATRALLVQTDSGRNILFETGVGTFFDEKLKKRYGITPDEHVLLKNLQILGVNENDIDAVVLSHLHFDHAGGLLPEYDDTPMRLNFPNANYYVSKSHWDYAQNPHWREKASFIPLLHELLEQSDRLVLIDKAEHPDLEGIASFWYSDGHTKGMMLSVINLDSGPLVFVTDLIPGAAWVHLPIAMGYDRFAELKIDEKQKLYETFMGKNTKLFFTHDPNTACGELKQDEKGKVFVDPVKL